MGFIGDLFSGDKGAGFQAEGATMDQANNAYGQAQGALAQQQAFSNAVNQQIPGALQSQQQLMQQYAQQAQGQGPNPAQAALAQATGQNVANQAALMAGQRGSNANVGLLARQAAQQGAATQQQAAGQGAVLQAQQSLAAQQALGNLAGTQVGQAQSANQLTNQAALQGQQNLLGSVANRNNANAGIAAGNAAGQKDAVGGLLSGVGSFLGLAHGGEVRNYAAGGPVSKAASFFQNPQGSTPAMTAGFAGLLGGLGNVFKPKAAPAVEGPMPGQSVEDYTSLSDVRGQNPGDYKNLPDKPLLIAGMPGGPGEMPNMGFAKGGKVKAMVSPGERYLSPSDVKKVKEGHSPTKLGEKIPGKPKVKGDSEINDTVPKTLKTGGIVVPNSVEQSDDVANKARAFVEAILAAKKSKKRGA